MPKHEVTVPRTQGRKPATAVKEDSPPMRSVRARRPAGAYDEDKESAVILAQVTLDDPKATVIEKRDARKVLAAELAGMMSETYARAYRRIVTVQQLSEMEEILTYLRLAQGGNVQGAAVYGAHMRNTWTARMRGVSRSVDVWNRILSVR